MGFAKLRADTQRCIDRAANLRDAAAAADADERAATLAGEVERLFKGEPSVSVPSAVAPPQYGATRRRWFQEVPPTEWFRHHHLIDPWVRYHTEGFPTPPPEPEPAAAPGELRRRRAAQRQWCARQAAPWAPQPAGRAQRRAALSSCARKCRPCVRSTTQTLCGCTQCTSIGGTSLW